jgi:hypothetical protein
MAYLSQSIAKLLIAEKKDDPAYRRRPLLD